MIERGTDCKINSVIEYRWAWKKAGCVDGLGGESGDLCFPGMGTDVTKACTEDPDPKVRAHAGDLP
jgi:hypothetical protein